MITIKTRSLKARKRNARLSYKTRLHTRGCTSKTHIAATCLKHVCQRQRRIDMTSSTANPNDARAHARAMAGTTVEAMPMQPPYRLLAVGRFARTKGFPELLTAMARLRRENVPVTLTLVGDGNWRRKLTKMRDALGLADIVDMPGFIPHDKICDFMLDHDMLIMPSVVHTNGDRDGIPNVIMEALSHRMPVIATDVCGISEVIIDGKTGLLVQQRDPRALAQAVRRMLADRQAAQDMAEAGRALVEKLFDPARNITAVYDLYVAECARAAQVRDSGYSASGRGLAVSGTAEEGA